MLKLIKKRDVYVPKVSRPTFSTCYIVQVMRIWPLVTVSALGHNKLDKFNEVARDNFSRGMSSFYFLS